MTLHPLRVLLLLWLGWAAYWAISAVSAKPTAWRESGSSRAAYMLPALLASALLWIPRAFPGVLSRPFAPPSTLLGWAGIGLVVIGLGFSVWARVHLGRNWSGTVTVKEGHELVQSGPYRHVRHPIYTGILIAILGTALTLDAWRAILALILICASFVFKLRVEEARMGETFPQYADYRRRTAALFPFIY